MEYIIQLSTNLFRCSKLTTISFNEALAVFIEISNNGIDDLRKRKKLTLIDMHNLRVRILENSGSVGLAVMVVTTAAFLQRLEDKATQEALTTNLTLLTYKRCVDDDCHAKFEAVHQSHNF